MIDTRSCLMTSKSACGSRIVSDRASTTLAPHESGTASWRTEEENAKEAVWR